MASNDLPAIALASQIIAQAITEDIDEVVGQGAGLDRSVQHLLREVGQTILEQVYDQVDHFRSAEWDSVA